MKSLKSQKPKAEENHLDHTEENASQNSGFGDAHRLEGNGWSVTGDNGPINGFGVRISTRWWNKEALYRSLMDKLLREQLGLHEQSHLQIQH